MNWTRGFLKTMVHKEASLGAKATLLPGIEVGDFSMIAAGSVVTRLVKPYSLVMGNPVFTKRWICKCARKLEFENNEATCCD